MRHEAQKHHGECLSPAYVNAHTHLLWRCRSGHAWKATPNAIRNGQWCPKCVGQGKTISDMQKAARSRQGFCLSKKYAGMFVKLQWQCKKGHVFETTPNHVVNHASWCPHCYLETKYLSPTERHTALTEMKELARLKGGWCLSNKYTNSQTHLRWRCRNGHEWQAAPSHIKHSGTWCATCAVGVSERICRAILEKIFGTSFPKKKPSWLVSSRGTRMELDGYSEKAGIAFEYQGIQHFVKNAHFHSGRVTLRSRQADDRLKAALCKQRGVVLLQIQYTVPHAKLGHHIRALIGIHGIGENVNAIRNRTRTGKIDIFALNAYSPAHMLEMQKLANQRGGECLSKAYVNNTTKLRWRCKREHIWSASPSMIKVGHWCPDCAGNRRLTLDHMKTLARKRGGNCLAEEYCGGKSKILWKCAKGHTWKAKPDNIKTGKWCPYCAKRPPINIDDVRVLAKARGGQCLSTRYENALAMLRFRCAKGHVWQTNENRLQQGRWCPVCGRQRAAEQRRRYSIADMRKTAEERCGKCLSENYVSVSTALHWQCSDGHHWFAMPANVKRGTWCPTCAGRKAVSSGS